MKTPKRDITMLFQLLVVYPVPVSAVSPVEVDRQSVLTE